MRLHGLVVVVAVVDVAALGDPEVTAEVVDGLAPVELPADAAPEDFLGEPADGVHGAQQLAVLKQGFG